MERDNKKARDDARKEYNEAVRVGTPESFDNLLSDSLSQDLVRFLRKRDKRYKDFTEKQAKSPKEPTAASTARPTAASETKFVEQEWQRVHIVDDDNDAGQWDDAEGAEMWECVACGKTFRSEPAWLSHERSRKHLKEVERCACRNLIL